MELAEYAAARAGDLLARARRLSGDDSRAERVLVDALASLPRRLGTDPDERVDRALLRRAAAEPGGAARVAGVLRDVDGLTPDEAADVLGWSRRRVVREAAAARATPSSPGPTGERPSTPPDLIDRVRAAAAARRRRRVRVAALVTAAAVVVVAVTQTAGYVERRASRLPTPHAAGLVPWPPRGELVHDRGFVRAAAREWREHGDRLRGPLGKIYVLYAGRIGVGRIALLQALRGGQGRVAVVAEHDVTFNHPALQVDDDTALPTSSPSLLLVPYDGNLGLPGLQTGPGSRLLQALVAPDIDGLARRSAASSSPGAPRPGFGGLQLTRGMSRPWLDLSAQSPATALRIYRHGDRVLDALVPAGGSLAPEPVAVTVVAPPSPWSIIGSPNAQDFTEDGLWLAQQLHRPRVEIAPVWASAQRPLGEPMRLLLYDDGARAVFVSGAGAGSDSTFLDGHADALTTTHVDPVCLCLVAVGTSKVARFAIGDPPVVVRGRVAVRSVATQDTHVRAFDVAGHTLRVGG